MITRSIHRRRGLTLAELMVTTTIIGLLVIFIMPFYIRMVTMAYKTSGILYNTEALREFSTRFSADVQSANRFDLLGPRDIETGVYPILDSVIDNGSNHLRLITLDFRQPSSAASPPIQKVIGYYVDDFDGAPAPWAVRRYEVVRDTSVSPLPDLDLPNITLAEVRATHPIQGVVVPATNGQFFQRVGGGNTIYVNANVITPGSGRSSAINSLRLAVSLR
jgi:prepilin-type N-terminal cleavage/methylation domain-containing protein